jgi:hypothetical protein
MSLVPYLCPRVSNCIMKSHASLNVICFLSLLTNHIISLPFPQNLTFVTSKPFLPITPQHQQNDVTTLLHPFPYKYRCCLSSTQRDLFQSHLLANILIYTLSNFHFSQTPPTTLCLVVISTKCVRYGETAWNCKREVSSFAEERSIDTFSKHM